MADRLITPPDGGAVTLALVKSHLVIDHDADDALIGHIITAATKFAEKFCNRAILEQRWQALFPSFPHFHLRGQGFGLGLGTSWGMAHHFGNSHPPHDPYLELIRGSLSSALSVEVKYVDAAGAEQTLDPSVYLVDDASVPGRIRLAPNVSWPATQQRWDAVRISYSVGWAPGEVPEPIMQGLLLLISHMYENRVPEIVGDRARTASLTFSFEALLSPYKIQAL